MDEDAPEVSVVITTHNEEGGIGHTLAGLAAQCGAPPFEVVLVDDRSTDATVRIARAASLKGLRILASAPDPASPLTTRQQALDLGFRSAAAPIVMTLDGDSDLPADWIARMAAPIRAGNVAAVAGPITFVPAGTAVARWQCCDAAYYFLVSRALAHFGSGGVFFGNFAFRADLYDRLGGFATMGHALTEDLAFGLAIQRAGGRIAFQPSAQPVAVAPCPSALALVDRTVRVSSGPFTPLAAVLTIWPLTLLGLLILAPVLGGWVWAALGARYALGAAVVRRGLALSPGRGVGLFWLAYEPLAIALAGAVLLRLMKGKTSNWGGRDYAR